MILGMTESHKPDVADLLTDVKSHLVNIETLFRRRFDEISMEINATSQQIGMAEEGIATQFTEILKFLTSISHNAGGLTAANTGLELESVISDTEKAANTILDAADRIANRVHTQGRWDDNTSRDQMLQETRQDVQEILMACTFQDLTGQRIRKTLENLHLIESQLSETLGKLGIDIHVDQQEVIKEHTYNKASSQNDIDALFS